MRGYIRFLLSYDIKNAIEHELASAAALCLLKFIYQPLKPTYKEKKRQLTVSTKKLDLQAKNEKLQLRASRDTTLPEQWPKVKL